jgi:hypothetical protein
MPRPAWRSVRTHAPAIWSRSSYENPAAFMAEHYASFRAASVPFESEHWAKMPVDER